MKAYRVAQGSTRTAPAGLTLGQAHDQVSRLEVMVREELPQVRDIHNYEDRFLQAELPGYREYVGQVCYRLVPGVW